MWRQGWPNPVKKKYTHVNGSIPHSIEKNGWIGSILTYLFVGFVVNNIIMLFGKYAEQ